MYLYIYHIKLNLNSIIIIILKMSNFDFFSSFFKRYLFNVIFDIIYTCGNYSVFLRSLDYYLIIFRVIFTNNNYCHICTFFKSFFHQNIPYLNYYFCRTKYTKCNDVLCIT